MKKPLVATISKYPPYISGPSTEAKNQAKALFEITGYKHHQVTYNPTLYNNQPKVDDYFKLKEKSEKFVNIHRINPSSQADVKVFDGELIKAFIGRVINLVQNKGVNVLSTYYLDPHAYIANQAKLYAKKILNKEVITAHKAIGSDILNSIANHLEDGQGKFLLLQLLEGDLMFAVSQYAKDKIIEFSSIILPPEASGQIASKLQVLYAPVDNEYLRKKDTKAIKSFNKEFKINPNLKILSTFGRVFPEKGIDDLIKAYSMIKKAFPKTCLVIGGDGIELDNLKKLASDLKLTDIVFTGAILDPEKKRALMQSSVLGIIPTKPTPIFVETLCISALEYQASGCVMLTTRVGGVPEAAGEHSLYARHSDPKDLARKIAQVLKGEINREEIIKRGLEYTDKFNYLKITRQFLEMIAQKREIRKPSPLTIEPEFWLTPNLIKPYDRRYKV